MTVHIYAPASPVRATSPEQRYDALLAGLARRTVARATGTSLPLGTRIADEPKQRLWLGMLASEPELIADALTGNTRRERLTPPAQGFTFRLATLPATLELTVVCSAYLALHPTLQEQREAVTAEEDASADAQGNASSPTSTAQNTTSRGRTARTPGYKLAPVWTKATIDPVRLTVDIPAYARGAIRVGDGELASALRAARRPPAGAMLYRPRRARTPAGSLPRDHDLVDETTWARYSADNLLTPDEITLPEHRAAVEIEVTAADGYFEVLVAVVNTTPAHDDQLFDGLNAYERGAIETRLYEVSLTARTKAVLVPYELEQVADSYRYDRQVAALGHACPVTTEVADGVTTLRTQFAAEQRTWRVYPRRQVDTVPIDTTFDSLIADPVGCLERLVAAHARWVDESWSRAALDSLGRAHGWDVDARSHADADAVAAREEVAWVRAGVELIRTNSDIRDAFVMANQVVKDAAGGRFSSWHPFQVAWIVGCLPGLADPASHCDVDIVWFATGGGKSEAYLGLMLVTLFYGRLTGTTGGAQVWARFPLRLLALQQTDRFAEMVMRAELLRQRDPRISGGEPFGIGYFVGGGNTPNKLYLPNSNNPYYRGQDPHDLAVAELCRVLERCPICGERPEVSFDEPTHTMRHICRNGACRLAGILPVWGVDDDVYRRAPSVIVGTVDKLAQLGMNQAFQILLGKAHSWCPKHGYSTNPRYCAVFGCQETRRPVPRGFGHIRLEIADELHLLDESLGALDGMYETLLQAISDSFGHLPMQIVGATATIEGYQNQVKHLYQRGARRFPVNGPVVGETFWSTTALDEPMRRFLGLRSRASTMVTATREVAVTHAEWVADLLEHPKAVVEESGLDAGDPEIVAEAQAAGRDLYEVLVAYCLRNEDLTSFTRDQAVRERLTSQDQLAVINSDASAGDIRETVRRLINPASDDSRRVKIIAATKAIGHGFDVHRLGVMAVMGTPTQASEIIQASARVGRRFPGLVINVINPQRDRDASVFRYYADWIRFLDRLVHKVPVNRESLPVLKRVLSGGLMAWLLQVHDRAWVTGGPRRDTLARATGFRDAVNAGFIDRTLLIDNLMRGFGISPDSVYHQMHREAISAWVDDQIAALPLRAEGTVRLPELLHPPVPRSLRDVEEPIVIYGEV